MIVGARFLGMKNGEALFPNSGIINNIFLTASLIHFFNKLVGPPKGFGRSIDV